MTTVLHTNTEIDSISKEIQFSESDFLFIPFGCHNLAVKSIHNWSQARFINASVKLFTEFPTIFIIFSFSRKVFRFFNWQSINSTTSSNHNQLRSLLKVFFSQIRWILMNFFPRLLFCHSFFHLKWMLIRFSKKYSCGCDSNLFFGMESDVRISFKWKFYQFYSIWIFLPSSTPFEFHFSFSLLLLSSKCLFYIERISWFMISAINVRKT